MCIRDRLENVLKGAENLIRWKRLLKSPAPHVIFQFLVVKPNEHQIPELYALAERMGVDEVKLKTAQVYDYRHGNPLIPETEKYARYRKMPDGTWEIKNRLLDQCWKMWHSCVITWDGIVVPCCFDKDAAHQLGDLKAGDFREIWRGKEYHAFRRLILKGRQHIDICRNCTEGCRVWA
jgi:radical SAM protein with 4Fe4S-binding SPASM domain